MPPPAALSAGLAGELAAPAAEPLLHVVQLRELDLRLALGGLRVLGEDVEDQRGPVDHLDLEPVLEVPQLAGVQLAVADDGVGTGGLHHLAQAVDLAATDVRRRVSACCAAGRSRRAPSSRPSRRAARARPWSSRRPPRGAGGPHPDQHHALEAQLPVLDLGDVLQLGGQAGHAAQGVALGQVLHTDGELGVLGPSLRPLFWVGLVGVAGRPPVVGLFQCDLGFIEVPAGRLGQLGTRARSLLRSSYDVQGRWPA